MNGIKIVSAGCGIPEKVVTNDDLSRLVDTSDQWIASRTGIRCRRQCGAGQTHTDLCLAAAREALARGGVLPGQIGACIVATMTPDTVIPSAACRLQQALGLPEDTLCFDLNAACSGFVFALHTMQCLLQASERKFGLVVGADELTRVVDWTDRSTCVLFGDGAGAAVVESRPEWPAMSADLGARGDDRLLRIAGPAAGEDMRIRMEGREVFRFAVETVPRCMERVLAKAGCAAEDVDAFVFHQANARIMDFVIRQYALPPEKCFKNIDAYGNTSAASIPLLLGEMYREGKVDAGSRVLLVAFGGGLTWGGALIDFA